ncbi:MAG TPA: aminoacyl-tRNA hydrolase [Thermomicrobiaceae bacterium]|nr:aminoacyl-tRNA hydrolase [Thermomicrobiaceae bacterium]
MSGRATVMIAGLGNPGRKYAGTRHNIGFLVVDELARRLPRGENRRRFDSQLTETSTPGARVVLLKPETFMNLSGNAVSAAARWYRVPPERVLLVHDDMDLPFGQLRLRPGGSSGGHNGVTSVIQQLGTERIPRLRIGIGRPELGTTISYVLNRFTRDEERALPDVVANAADAALSWERDGIEVAMNLYNRRDVPPRASSPRERSTEP